MAEVFTSRGFELRRQDVGVQESVRRRIKSQLCAQRWRQVLTQMKTEREELMYSVSKESDCETKGSRARI